MAGYSERKNVSESYHKNTRGKFTYPCKHPWEELVVAADGTVGLCCLDFNLTSPLGNVMETDIAAIWHGEKLRALRQ